MRLFLLKMKMSLQRIQTLPTLHNVNMFEALLLILSLAQRQHVLCANHLRGLQHTLRQLAASVCHFGFFLIHYQHLPQSSHYTGDSH